MEDSIIMIALMSTISLIFLIVILVLIRNLIVRRMEKGGRIRRVDAVEWNRFVEEIKRENAEMKKDLQIIKEKAESIDKMMREI